ncbi:MAG: terminase small subunit [Acidiferrobacterales bacterium]|nr:terminase small subunit [Acidiferrobacterales bacterium]
MSLTPKQQRFVGEYLIDLNATQAAIRAGYSEHTAKQQGYENLTKPYVQEAIAEAMLERSERTELSQDWVLAELRNVHAVAIKDGNLAAANKSLELLGRHLGLFTDNLKLSGGVQISHEEALAQLK